MSGICVRCLLPPKEKWPTPFKTAPKLPSPRRGHGRFTTTYDADFMVPKLEDYAERKLLHHQRIASRLKRRIPPTSTIYQRDFKNMSGWVLDEGPARKCYVNSVHVPFETTYHHMGFLIQIPENYMKKNKKNLIR